VSVSHINSLIDSYNIKYHQFTDDTQLLVTLDTVNSAQIVSRLSECTAACRETLATVQQSPAQSKSQVVAPGTTQHLQSAAVLGSVDTDEYFFSLAQKRKSLGVTICF